MSRIRTTQKTVGKINTQQQGQLEPCEVIDILPNEEFKVVGEEAGHYIVQLRIFKGHAELVDGDRTIIHSLRINEAGKALIKEFEGRRLTSYLCPAQVWTIGFGSTDGIAQGMTITKERAEELLDEDLARFEKGVLSAVKVALNENQFSALVSFAFNVGLNTFDDSTLLKMLNRGRYKSAADEFIRWIWSDDRILEGLVRRREAERELFLEAVN